MKKRVVALFLAALMILSLCACQNSTDDKKTTEAGGKTTQGQQQTDAPTEGGEPTTEEPKSAYPIVEEPITIKVVAFPCDFSVSEERLVWQKVEEITGINIEWEFIDAEALPTYLAGGEWPDLFHMDMSNVLVEDYGVYGGRFVNFLDKLDIMPHLQTLLEDYPTAEKAFSESNGEMYKLPAISKAVTNVYIRAFARTDLLDKAGVKMPTTVDEFAQALRDLKAYYGKAQWAPNFNNETNAFEPLVYAAFGTDCDMSWNADANGKVVYAKTTDQTKHYYEFMNMLYEEGLIHPESATLSYDMRLEYEDKDVTFISSDKSTRLDTSYFENGVIQMAHLEPLTSKYDSTQKILGRSSINRSSWSYYVNSESQYVDEICKMIDIVCAKEEVVEGSGLYGVSFNYGMQGEQWDFTEDGKAYELFAPESYNGSFSNYQTKELVYKNSGRFDVLGMMVTATPGNGQVRQMEFRDKVWPYVQTEEEIFPTSMLTFTEDENETINSVLTDINSYVKQMRVEFITGVTDIEAEWDNYCATLEQMGLPDVVAAYQAAYDRWMAK